MERGTETLLRWSLISWLWVFAVLAGLATGELVKKWPAPTGWNAPSQLANGSVIKRNPDRYAIQGFVTS